MMPEPTATWYRGLFLGEYFRLYKDLLPPERTAQEVDFLERALALSPGGQILDLCCGWGRHGVALAQRGYRVTGLDLSESLLAEAQRLAKAAGVEIHLIHADMREIPFSSEMDVVINMFSAFGYLESDEEDFRVLQGAARALKLGGKFFLDTANREWLVRNYEPEGRRELPEGAVLLEHRRFDPLTSRNHVTLEVIEPGGGRSWTGHIMRLYTLTELAGMLERAGLYLLRVWGGFGGEEYGLDSRRLILLAQKQV